MELFANWTIWLERFATTLKGTEWVGIAVLVFAVIAIWTVIRGPKPGWQGPSARIAGACALGCILFAIWVGASVHLLFGAVLLAIGCGLAFWSLLLRFGIGWRQHIRPGIVPVLVCLTIVAGFWFYPRTTGALVAIAAFWVQRTLRNAAHAVDAQLNALSTRALALTHYEAAAYLCEVWFQRFAPHASNISLLTLSTRARALTFALPRARTTVHAADSLYKLSVLSEIVLDQRLRTDGSASRFTSWIRVVTRELYGRLLHRSGAIWLFRFVSDLLLAVPPATEESWADRARNVQSAPDPGGYVVALVADLPSIMRAGEIDALRDRVTRDADAAGPSWLTAIAIRAESWREETPSTDRDLRIEVVAEALWGVYEAVLGPRPARYDLYDQLRLQAPELAERSSVQDARTDGDALLLHLNGVPRAFHELGRGNPLVLQTGDDRVWHFRRLETTETGVVLVFAGDGHPPQIRGPRMHARKQPQVTRTKTAAALAAVTSQ